MNDKVKLQIQLSSKNKVVSKLTRWITRGSFDHVDIVMTGDALIGAHIFSGIKQTVFNRDDFSKIKRYEIEVSPKVNNWIYKQIGRKYDFLAILGFVFKVPIRETTASICSSFAFDVLKKSKSFHNAVKYVNFKSTEISPRDLHLVLQILAATNNAKLLKNK